VANAFYAIGQADAIGYSPFGIDDLSPNPDNNPLARAYGVLAELAPLILQNQASGTIAGVWLTIPAPMQIVTLGNYTLTFDLRRNRRDPTDVPERGYAIVMPQGPDAFLVAGADIQVSFAPAASNTTIAGLLSVEEGTYQAGAWVPGRRLNGDEVQLRYDLNGAAHLGQSGAGLRFPGGGPTIQQVKLYQYK
jgi:hypothetical protein